MTIETVTPTEGQAGEVQESSPVFESLEAYIEDARKALIAEGQGQQTQDAQEQSTAETEAKDDGQTPSEEESQVQDDVDEKKLSRREAFKLAEERAQALKEAEAENQKLQQQIEARAKADQELTKKVVQALGSPEQYEQLTRRARAGDRQAGALLDQLDANREFYGEMVKKAERDLQAFFAGNLFKQAKELGISEDTIFKGTPDQIVQAAYKAGQEKAKAELTPELENLRAELSGSRVARASNKSGAPLSGGKSSNTSSMEDWFDENGVLKEEYIQAGRRGDLMI